MIVATTCPALAQEHVTLQSNFLFYGDNTEFRNPFREGDTLFGTAVRAAFVFDLGERTKISLGALGNIRFGADEGNQIQDARPVVVLTITGKRSMFVFGTLNPPRIGITGDPAFPPPLGPDRTGPHGLLPPLQRETLVFDRPHEAGMAWAFAGQTLRHEMWINWQRVNTREHRERFDTGVNGNVRLSRLVTLPFQLHVVHEGGQLFASGPVADSAAGGAGLDVRGSTAWFQSVGLELYGLASRYVPDRASPERSRDGGAFFGRASATRAGWRGHLIVWRGSGYIKDEGDPNYLSVRRDGSRYRGVRDYAEVGLSRVFQPTPGVVLEASGRFHRVERHYEYSFRIVASAIANVRLR
jgi:hypothetical protein